MKFLVGIISFGLNDNLDMAHARMASITYQMKNGKNIFLQALQTLQQNYAACNYGIVL
jgi:hypothetical protein